jgi:hypothetical chaperone protein
MTVLEHRLGHRIASEVEAAKIAVSVHGTPAAIDLGAIEAGLSASLSAQQMGGHLAGLLEQVVDCAGECVRRAGRQAPDAVYLTGGSSALRPFRAVLERRFAGTAIVEGDLFGGVASGLSYATGPGHS